MEVVDWLGGWSGSDDLVLSGDQLLVDLSDQSLLDSDLLDEFLQNLLNSGLTDLEGCDGSLDRLDLLWLSWLDEELLWWSFELVDLLDDLLDSLLDVDDMVSDLSDTLLQDNDLLLDDWFLWSWSGLELLDKLSDGLLDDGLLVEELGDLLDVVDNGGLELLDNLLLRSRVEARQGWSGELLDLGSVKLKWLVALVIERIGTGTAGLEGVASLLACLLGSEELIELSLFLASVLASEDWLHELGLLDGDLNELGSSMLDDLLDDSDLLDEFLHSLSEDNELFGDLLLLDNSGGNDLLLENSDLLLDDMDLFDEFLQNNDLLGDSLLEDGDLLLLSWSEDGSWLGDDLVDLDIDRSDGSSNDGDLLDNLLDGLSKDNDLLGKLDLLGWLSLDLSDESGDSSSDDSLLGDQLGDLGSQLGDDLLELDDLLLFWLRMETQGVWSVEFLASVDDGLVL